MRKVFRLAITLAIAATSPIVAQASPAKAEPQWVEINTDPSTGEVDWVDANSIKRKGSNARFLFRAKFKEDADGWDTAISDVEVNCDTHELKLWSVEVTFTNGTTKREDTGSKWYSIPDGSYADFAYQYVCKE